MSRRAALLVLACTLALAAAPAQAQEGGETAFTLTAVFRDGQYVWEGEGGTANPTLNVPANSEITVTIQQDESSDGVPHNLQVGGGEVSDQIQATGDTATYTFNSPPSGTVDYVCTIHPTTMLGTVSVGGAGGEDAGGNGAPGPGVLAALLALVGLALLRHRR